MFVNDKVMYKGCLYTVLHDYQNGQLEIMKIDERYLVELVYEKEIIRL